MANEEHPNYSDFLAAVAQNIVQVWMRAANLPGEENENKDDAKVRWQAGEHGVFVLEQEYASLGRYKLAIDVIKLPDLPPIGPENDPAQRYEKDLAPGTFCEECTTPGEDPAPWCGCRRDGPRTAGLSHSGPCRLQAHNPSRCPQRPHKEWLAATFANVAKGDQIRIPGSPLSARVCETPRHWHIAESPDRYHPTSWPNVELTLHVDNEATPMAPLQFSASQAVQILCTPAELALRKAFPGTIQIEEVKTAKESS